MLIPNYGHKCFFLGLPKLPQTHETSTKVTYTKGSPRERWQLR